VIELSLIYYVLKNNDDMTLLKLDESKFLDSKVKAYLTRLKDYKAEYEILPSVKDFQTLVNNDKLFDDVKEIGDSLLPFYLTQVEERYNKYTFFNKLYDVINTSKENEFGEVVSQVQELILDTQQESVAIEEVDCSEPFEEEEFITRIPLGLGRFDDVNGGLASSELALLGGHRGQGKSILALHSALTRFLNGKTVAFISIEMRASEVKFRLDAMVTGLPVKDIQFNRLDDGQIRTYFQRKATTFCEPDLEFQEYIMTAPVNKSEFTKAYSKLKRKDNKFFLYDLPLCNLSDINYIANKLKKIHKLNFMIVDYLNIIKVPSASDSIDWKVQLQRSEGLKTIARSTDIALLSPIQISDEGVVKFAKAIEDPVDLSIFFSKQKSNEAQDALNLYVSKIRNGTDLKFSMVFNKENLRVSRLKDKD